ncbi:MAG: acetyl-CoA carboxylase carboxyltransferase subunit alpha [Alphaproteobacteria bacterium]|nr:acetyl-CoA carboxylase carboxyltransferase subunit alpha [Alphaproteobacteria bacterium]
MHYLDFERPIADLEGKIEELRHLANTGDMNIAEEILRLQAKADKMLKTTYGALSSWQRVQVARHPDRPQFFDYLTSFITDFMELAGDRLFGNDNAIIGGMGRFQGRPVMVIGQQKGRDTESRIKHNFGMAQPEGYRKAQRLMHLAEKFNLPIITFIDTAGAYPGLEAEERGQAEAIAKSIDVCLSVKVPLISVIIGEGGSGGAIAIAAANKVLMLENAVYSIISPEGCASILWRSATKAKEAAEALRPTAPDLFKLGVIDDVVPEGLGGAHRNTEKTVTNLEQALAKALASLSTLQGDKLVQHRREKFLAMGNVGL